MAEIEISQVCKDYSNGMCASASAGSVIGHCVSTAQQLQNALSSASNGGQYNGMDNRIKIVQGLYQTRLVTNPGPGTFFYENDANTGVLSVEGGYNADCSARSSNPLATLIDGNSLYPVMDLRSKKGQVKVSGVTIENGESISQGGGLSINVANTDDSAVLVFDTIIRNNHTTRFGGGLYVGSDGTGNMDRGAARPRTDAGRAHGRAGRQCAHRRSAERVADAAPPALVLAGRLCAGPVAPAHGLGTQPDLRDL